VKRVGIPQSMAKEFNATDATDAANRRKPPPAIKAVPVGKAAGDSRKLQADAPSRVLANDAGGSKPSAWRRRSTTTARFQNP
jgi:hypothetical protein